MNLLKHNYFVVVSLLREFSALCGYNFLYYGASKYFFVNFFDRDNVTLIYTIPFKVVGVEK